MIKYKHLPLFINIFQPFARLLQASALLIIITFGLVLAYWSLGAKTAISLPRQISGMDVSVLIIFALVLLTGMVYFFIYREYKSEAQLIRDPLTGLLNRYNFNKQFKDEFTTTITQRTHLSIICFDIDHLKNINKSYGYVMGDKVLAAVAEAVGRVLRKHEVLARIGGDEFAVLLPGCKQYEAEFIAKRLENEIGRMQVFMDDSRCIQVTASFGLAEHETSDNIASLYQKVDLALDKAKHNHTTSSQQIA